MRVLRILAPSADEALAQQVRDAVLAFNRGLDIRLRFLSIMVEDRELRLSDPESAVELVGTALADAWPTVILVQGDDETALAAATVAARSGDAVVAHLGAGVRAGDHADASRAIDRVCGLLLPLADDASATLREEGLAERVTALDVGSPPRQELGHQVIKALRAERIRRRGDATC